MYIPLQHYNSDTVFFPSRYTFRDDIIKVKINHSTPLPLLKAKSLNCFQLKVIIKFSPEEDKHEQQGRKRNTATRGLCPRGNKAVVVQSIKRDIAMNKKSLII